MYVGIRLPGEIGDFRASTSTEDGGRIPRIRNPNKEVG
jgi:hypothetical protein